MIWEFPPQYRLTPKEVLDARAARAREICAARGLDGLLLTHAPDVYWLSGSMQQGAVFLPADGEPVMLARRHAPRAQAESPIAVEPVSGYTQVAARVLKELPAGAKLGMCLDVVVANQHQAWLKRLEGLEVKDAAGAWLDMLAVKDEYEIGLMAETGALTAKLYDDLPGILQEGRTELACAGEFLARAMAAGVLALARARAPYMEMYPWHLVAGPDASLPSAVDTPSSGWGPWPAFPQGAGLGRLERGQPIIVDVGVTWQGYMTDQTRTFCLGPAPDELHRAHECLVKVEAVIMELLRPGAVSGEIFAAARQTAVDMGFGDYYLGQDGTRVRFAGHGLGLELGVPPYILDGSKAVVRAGETYALELKIVLPAGPVGLENTVAVEPEGPPRILSPIPAELVEL